jgi:hypothetical protein
MAGIRIARKLMFRRTLALTSMSLRDVVTPTVNRHTGRQEEHHDRGHEGHEDNRRDDQGHPHARDPSLAAEPHVDLTGRFGRPLVQPESSCSSTSARPDNARSAVEY